MVTAYAGTSHPGVRHNNRAAIFRTLYESAPITRVDIAARTGLSAKTVSIIMDELISHGLVRELGRRESSGAGRKAVELEVDPSSRFALGIDVAPPTVTAALVDLAGRIREQVVDADSTEQPPWNASQILRAAHGAAQRLTGGMTAEAQNSIVGVGIGAPGRFKIDGGHYVGLRGAFLTEWADLGSTAELDRMFGYPVTMDNNANTGALAEQWFGNGKDVGDFVLLNVSRAIGMGIVIGGEVYRGGNQIAGEAGHLSVDINGPRCSCGNSGCLDLVASVQAVMQAVRARLAAGEPSSLRDTPDLSIREVIAAFQLDDPVAVAVIGNAIRYLAASLVAIINTYDPELILIGRAYATAGDRFFDQLRSEVRGRLSPALRGVVRIEPADVGDAGVIGAGTLALRTMFRDPLVGTGI
jgi:N-acetylglucosamine repressor